MADDKEKQEGSVPVEDMITHPPSDWAEWMDRPEPYYEGKPPTYAADATKTDREKEQDSKEQEAKKDKPAPSDRNPNA